MFELTLDDCPSALIVALVEARETRIEAAPAELRDWCSRAVLAARTAVAGGDARRQEIRGLLRRGGFRPTGRNKPAQEYLLRTALDGDGLPAISNAVDLINVVSLQCGLPISLVALDRIGTRLSLRIGAPGDRFVFNRSGQELDVAGLLSIGMFEADEWKPVATPVKDSMRAKVADDDRHLLACIYASREAIDRTELVDWADQLAAGFREFCGAAETSVSVRGGEEDL